MRFWDDWAVMRICYVLGALGAVTLGLSAVASADVQMLSPFDVTNPAVGNLDPALLIAVQQATTAAAARLP